jgi:elongation factor Tu
VEDVFSISGRGTVVTGRAEASIKVGDAVSFQSPGGSRTTTVTGIEMFRKLIDEANAGDSVGLLLKGVEKKDVSRGLVLTRAG